MSLLDSLPANGAAPATGSPAPSTPSSGGFLDSLPTNPGYTPAAPKAPTSTPSAPTSSFSIGDTAPGQAAPDFSRISMIDQLPTSPAMTPPKPTAAQTTISKITDAAHSLAFNLAAFASSAKNAVVDQGKQAISEVSSTDKSPFPAWVQQIATHPVAAGQGVMQPILQSASFVSGLMSSLLDRHLNPGISIANKVFGTNIPENPASKLASAEGSAAYKLMGGQDPNADWYAPLELKREPDTSNVFAAFASANKNIDRTPDQQKAYDVGQFLGWIIPYSRVSEGINAAADAAKLSEYAPRLAPIIPKVADAMSFLSTGQILHTPDEGSRLDQLKNDATTLAFFEIGGAAIKGTGMLAEKGYGNLISSSAKTEANAVLEPVYDKMQNGEKVPIDEFDHAVTRANNIVEADTGKTPKELLQEQTGVSEKTATERPVPKPQVTKDIPMTAREFVESKGVRIPADLSSADFETYKKLEAAETAQKKSDHENAVFNPASPLENLHARGAAGKEDLRDLGFSPVAATHGSADVYYIGKKPVLAQSWSEGALAGFAVHPDFQGKGVGTAAIRELMKDGPLQVYDPNSKMMSLLRKVGDVSEPDGRGVVTVTPKSLDMPATPEEAATRYQDEVLSKVPQGSTIEIAGDNMKDHFGKDYVPERSDLYAKASFQTVENLMKDPSKKSFTFLGSGPGSGKSEIIGSAIKDSNATDVLYDTTLSSLDGSRKLIDLAKSEGKDVHIAAALQDLDRAWSFTQSRAEKTGRVVPADAFARGHAGFVNTLRTLLQDGTLHPDQVDLYDFRGKSLAESKAMVANGDFVKDPLATLKEIEYNKEDIAKRYAKQDTTTEGKNSSQVSESSSRAREVLEDVRRRQEGRANGGEVKLGSEIKLPEFPENGRPLLGVAFPGANYVARFIEKDIIERFGSARDAITGIYNASKDLFTPNLGKEKAAAIVGSSLMKVEKYASAAWSVAEKRRDWWAKMTEEQHYDFIDKIETGNAEYDQFDTYPLGIQRTMADLAAEYRARLDKTFEEESDAGVKHAYVQDYFPHMWEDPEAAQEAFAKYADSFGKGYFTKMRTIELIQLGRELGLKLKTSNPEEIVLMREIDGQRIAAKIDMMRELENEGLAMRSPARTESDAMQGLKLGKEFQKDALAESPVRALLKMYPRGKSPQDWTLAEIQKQAEGTKKPAARLDSYVTELGFKDMEHAQEALDKYFDQKDSLRGMNEAIKSQREADREVTKKAVEQFHKKTAGWPLVNGADGRQYAVTPDAARILKNAFFEKSLWSQKGFFGTMFRSIMAVKGFVTPVKLSLSLFHPIHIAFIDSSSERARLWESMLKGNMSPQEMLKQMAKPTLLLSQISDFREYGEIAEVWDKPWDQLSDREKTVVQYVIDGGGTPKMSEEFKIRAMDGFKKAVQDENYIGAAIRGVPQVIENYMQKPVFEAYIPALKIASYVRGVEELLRTKPELATDDGARKTEFRKLWKSMDNRFGQMVYKTTFWNPMLKEVGQAAFLSLGWNAGFVREFGGGALDLLKYIGKTPRNVADAASGRVAVREALTRDITQKMLFSADYALQAAFIGGLMTYAMTGKMPKGPQDLFFPNTGKTNPDGSDARVNTSFYTREYFGIVNHFQKQGVIQGSISTVQNKMSPVLNTLADIFNNKDFYGYEIRDPSQNPARQAEQVLDYLVANNFSPISVSGAQNTSATTGLLGQALSYAGFSPAPKYIAETPIQTQIYAVLDQRTGGTKPLDSKPAADAKKQIRQFYEQGNIDGANQALDAAIQAGYISQKGKGTFISSLDLPADVRAFKDLAQYPGDQENLLAKMSEDDLARYAQYAASSVKDHLSSLSPAAKQFVDDLHAGKIHLVEFKAGKPIQSP